MMARVWLAILSFFSPISSSGIHPTQGLVSHAFVWSGLSKNVSDWAKGCLHFQKSKVLQHLLSHPQIPFPAQIFHMDLIEPLPSSRGFTHLFTIMDRTSCWPEAIPLSSTLAEDCSRSLVSCWIFRFGVPARLHLMVELNSPLLYGVYCVFEHFLFKDYKFPSSI